MLSPAEKYPYLLTHSLIWPQITHYVREMHPTNADIGVKIKQISTTEVTHLDDDDEDGDEDDDVDDEFEQRGPPEHANGQGPPEHANSQGPPEHANGQGPP